MHTHSVYFSISLLKRFKYSRGETADKILSPTTGQLLLQSYPDHEGTHEKRDFSGRGRWMRHTGTQTSHTFLQSTELSSRCEPQVNEANKGSISKSSSVRSWCDLHSSHLCSSSTQWTWWCHHSPVQHWGSQSCVTPSKPGSTANAKPN